MDGANNCSLYTSSPNQERPNIFIGTRSNNYQMTNVPTNVNWIGPEQMDYPYNDIQSFGINQVSDCSTACENNSTCAGFVVDDNADYCWLKSNFGAPNPVKNRNTFLKNENVISNTPNSNWIGPEQQVDYPGNDIVTMSTNKISDCSTACMNNPSCKGFVTTDMGDYCWIKGNMTTPISNVNRNSYKLKSNYKTIQNVNLKECENICQNNNTCKGFSYDTSASTCKISTEQIQPSSLNTSNIVGNKKKHMALNGMYNIYQNNACVNTNLFGNNPTIENSLGIKKDLSGVPVIPKYPICSNKLSNNFIFGNNYEIMAIQQDKGSSDNEICTGNWFDSSTCTNTDKSWDLNDGYCLQKNPDNSVSLNTCVYTDNQKWTYDTTLNNIRTWDGACLNVDTSNNNVKVSTKPCANDVNQQFNLTPVAKNLQPTHNVVSTNDTVQDLVQNASSNIASILSTNSNTTRSGGFFSDFFGNIENNDHVQSIQAENFATNINVNNYLSSNRNRPDYLYKLPYSSPYLMDINDSKENYESVDTESTSRSMYLIYLIVLVLLLVILMRK